MKDYSSHFFKRFLLFILTIIFHVDVIFAAVSTPSPIRLSGHIPAQAVANAAMIENLDPSTNIPLTFTLPLRNQEGLGTLLKRLYDPTDELYGQYLTSEEFAERFSPTQKDYNKVIAYAQSLGLTVTGTHSNRILLNVSGPVTTVQEAFNLDLHHYQAQDGRKFYAPSKNPEVSASIASIIDGVVGLDNSAVFRSYNRKKPVEEGVDALAPTPQTSPSGPGGGFSPNDIITAYNLTSLSGVTGTGQNIALFELGTYLRNDITTYATYFNLPTPNLTNVLVDGGAGQSGIDPEVALDIELAIALAPGSHIYVYEGPNSAQGVIDTYNRIATDNIAKQVSTSWGLGENLAGSSWLNAENAIFQQMAAHGQTIYAASGDSGAYGDYQSTGSLARVVEDPASQPYMTGVGGTSLTVNSSTGAWQNEVVWNDSLSYGASGGGVSGIWTIPSWQVGSATSDIQFSTTYRNVPDVALNANEYTGYSIYYNGSWSVYGGTSCAAPLWAAFTARVNQQLVANSNPTLGFANPSLYPIGKGGSYSSNFHDITSGNNLYYNAYPGYDNATGWGSFNGANLFATLTSSTPPPPPVTNPAWSITMTHNPNAFTRGGSGVYTITPKNSGNASTSGSVTVQITLPTGITCTSLSGSGWTTNKNTLICTRSSVLAPSASYPPISCAVSVSRFASTGTFNASSTVSGGGAASPATATSPTTIVR